MTYVIGTHGVNLDEYKHKMFEVEIVLLSKKNYSRFMSSNSDTIFTSLNVVITAIAVVVASIAIKVQQYYAKKQSDREAMTDIFGMLNETPHKSAEKNLYDAYKETGTLMKDGKLDPNREGPAEVVRRNYDQIGAMISSNLIPSTEYYRIFGVLTSVSYFILKESIEKEREKHKYHMAHFTNLAINCFNFWDKQKKEEKPEITDPKNKPITKDMLGEKIRLPKEIWWKFWQL